MLVNGKQMHTMLENGQAGEYCLLPGDPGRCETIAKYFDSSHFVASNREFTTIAGELDGHAVSVCSTGIGGPSAVIAMEELAAVGVHTFIRVGTCGGIKLDVQGGDCIIATGAARQEGTSLHYMPLEFPAVADFDVATALVDSAKSLGVTYHTGVVQSKDSFYGQHEPERMPVCDDLLYKWNAFKRGGVLASEMEGAALFVAAASIGVRAGMVLNVLWNQERRAAGMPDGESSDMSDAIKTAVGAMRLLIARDEEKRKNG